MIREEGSSGRSLCHPDGQLPPKPSTPASRLAARFEEIITRQVKDLKKDFEEIKEAIAEILDDRSGVPKST
jgi:hypothetical protein